MQIFLIILVILVFLIFFVIPATLYLSFLYTSLPLYLFASAMGISYTKLEGSLSSGLVMENASADWLSLKRLDISFDYDEDLDTFYLKKFLARDGYIELPKSSRRKKGPQPSENSRETQKFNEEQDSDFEDLPNLHVNTVQIRNIKLKAEQELKLHHLQIKDLSLNSEHLDISKFSLRTENTRLILKKAVKKLFFYGWTRHDKDTPKQNIKILLTNKDNGDKHAVFKSSMFDAALYYKHMNQNFKIKYIRRLGKSELKLPPISSFKFDFSVNKGEFYVGQNLYQSKLNTRKGIIFESEDHSFPLYFDLNGFKLGLKGKNLSYEQLGELWFGHSKLNEAQKEYLSNYIVNFQNHPRPSQ